MSDRSNVNQAPARPRPRFKDGASVAGFAQFVGGAQTRDAGAEDHDLRSVARTFERKRRRGAGWGKQVERRHRRGGRPPERGDALDEIASRSHRTFLVRRARAPSAIRLFSVDQIRRGERVEQLVVRG